MTEAADRQAAQRGLRRRTTSGVAVGVAAGAAMFSLVAVPTAASASTHQHVWETGKVVRLADGDTVDVKVGSKTYSVRDLDVQATEVKHEGQKTYECGSKAAKAYLQRLTLNKEVKLASTRKSAKSLGRLLRSVYVGHSSKLSHDSDVQAKEMFNGYTLWHPDNVDPTHNRQYHILQAEAQARGKHLWDPTACGVGTNPGATFKVWLNWDGNGNELKSPNTEWVAIQNTSAKAVNLRGWQVRDASHVGDPAFKFPKHTVIPAGRVLFLHSGKGHDNRKSLDFYNWGDGKARFDNNTKRGMGDGAYLQDNKENIRGSATYPCVVSCHDPLTQDLRFTRVEWNPDGNESNHPNEEYVDVQNVSNHRIDLTGHTFNNGGSVYPVARGTYLDPGETFRLYDGKGSTTRLVQHWQSSKSLFANTGEALTLKRPDDVTTMCVTWGSDHQHGCTHATNAQ